MTSGRAHVTTAMLTMIIVIATAKGSLGGIPGKVRELTGGKTASKTPRTLPSTQSVQGRSGFTPDAQASQGAGGGGGGSW